MEGWFPSSDVMSSVKLLFWSRSAILMLSQEISVIFVSQVMVILCVYRTIGLKL